MSFGLIAALAAMVCWGIGDFCIQRCTRKFGDIEALFFIGLIGSVLLFPFVMNDFGIIFSSSNMAMTFLFLGLITFAVSVINFEALKRGKLSIIEPLFVFELPATVILGIILFKETLSSTQFIFSFLILLGIFLISYKKFSDKLHKIFFEKGTMLALVAAFGFAAVNFSTAYVSRISNPLLAIWSAWAIFGIICFFILLKKKGIGKMIIDAKNYRGLVLAEGIFDTLSWVFFAIALVNLPLSITTAITESYPAIAVLLGVLYNKEKIQTHQGFGIFLTLISTTVLSLTII